MSGTDAKNLAELKRDLEEKITRAERELSLLKLSLKLVDEVLTRVSFKPASKLIEQQAQEGARVEPEERIPPPKAIEPKIPESTSPVISMEKPTHVEEEQPFPIKSKGGDDLGVLYVGRSDIRIVPKSDLRLTVRTPPFQTFFIDRVIGEMRRKDEMAVDAGSKDPMSMIEHEIVLDGEIISEIRIKNIDEDSRIREIRSSIRWTFERMMEKAGKPA